MSDYRTPLQQQIEHAIGCDVFTWLRSLHFDRGWTWSDLHDEIRRMGGPDVAAETLRRWENGTRSRWPATPPDSRPTRSTR